MIADSTTVPAPASFSYLPSAESLASWRSALDLWQDRGRKLTEQQPLEALTALVAGGATLYYLSERGRNEKVNTWWDALEYVSTCASVGYSNIFPNTPVGKLVASVLFLVGPALCARALDRPRHGGVDLGVHPEQELLQKLDAILMELQRLNGTPESVAPSQAS